MSCNITLRVSLYEPGFRDLALLTSKFSVKFSMCKCWYERVGWLGSRGLGFSNRDLGKRVDTFVLWALQPGYRDESAINLGSRWYCFAIYACCIFHIISIPFNCSDTTLRVTKAMIGAKVIILVFRHVCFISQISRRNSSTGLSALSSRNPGWKFPYEPKAKLFPQTRSARSTRLMWRGPKPIAFITVLVAVAVAVVVAQAPYWDVVGSSG